MAIWRDSYGTGLGNRFGPATPLGSFGTATPLGPAPAGAVGDRIRHAGDNRAR